MTTSKINSIKANPSNPRLIKNDKYKAQLKSIKDTPQMMNLRPVLIDDNRIILGGHMRWRACKELGWKEIPTESYTKEEHLTTDSWIKDKKTYEELCREITIKDNTHYGEYDFDILANEWDDLPLNDWGLDVWEPKEEEAEGLTDEDAVPEAPKEPITKLGDVWILGEHRVMCGDSTSKEAVEILMDGKQPDMVITDPPYGIDAISSSGVLSSRYEQYENEEDDSCALSFINICLNYGWDMIVFGGNYFAHALPKSTHWIIWDKRGADMKGGSANGDQSDCEIAWSNLKKKNVKIYKHVWAGWFRAGNKKDELKTKVHPSQKPVGLFETIFCDYQFDNFFDGFAGSGSTLIAAEKTNRKCYGMELDPKYCDVIVKRWEDFTGKKATREIDDLEVMTQAH